MSANTVVIVDDNDAMRQALRRLFKAAGGFKVCGEACNGSEAIELVQDLNPDVVVLDLCMPGMNGLETARELKNVRPLAQIILYSMNAEEILENQASAAGVSALVSKAEGIKSFITKARRVLNRSAA
jgi:DNA-binding NarL/FixJ family response regulator